MTDKTKRLVGGTVIFWGIAAIVFGPWTMACLTVSCVGYVLYSHGVKELR